MFKFIFVIINPCTQSVSITHLFKARWFIENQRIFDLLPREFQVASRLKVICRDLSRFDKI
jgi:hypothetical protein